MMREERPHTSLLDFLYNVYVPSRLDLSPDGVCQLEIVINQFNRYAGNPQIGQLTDEMVCGFLRHCLDKGLSPSTVNSKRSKIVALWNCAWRKRMHKDQPRDIPRLREHVKVPKAWTAEEVQCLVTHTGSLDGVIGWLPASWFWTTLVLATWETGLRIGALLKTRNADFRLEIPAIVARAQSQKTGVGQFCPITESTSAAIAEQLDFPRQRVWPWPYCQRSFYIKFRRIVEGAGLHASYDGHDLFHKLRRSHLSYIARKSLETARRQAGHTNAAITLRHYIDPRIADEQAAVELLPAITAPQPSAFTAKTA